MSTLKHRQDAKDIPSLWALSYALKYDKNWEWDYNYHGTCAMGLARALWPKTFPGTVVSADMARVFDMPFAIALAIFLELEPRFFRRVVTRKQVARAIDKYLAA